MRIQPRSSRRVAVTLAATGGLVFFAGCSAVLGIESDRHLVTTGADGSNDTAAPDVEVDGADAQSGFDANDGATERWGCMNDPIPTPAGDVVNLHIFFNDVSSAKNNGVGKPIPGAEVHPCTKLDLTCSDAGRLPGAITDDGGVARLSVPTGFDGYFEVHADNYTPAVLNRSPELFDELASQGMANIDLLSAAGSLTGITQDPSLSIAIISVADCMSNVAEGVVLEVGSPGPNESLVYFVNSLPSKSATSTDKATGSAIIFNVPLGTLTVSASLADKTPIRTVSALARKDWITFAQIRPDQAKRTPITP